MKLIKLFWFKLFFLPLWALPFVIFPSVSHIICFYFVILMFPLTRLNDLLRNCSWWGKQWFKTSWKAVGLFMLFESCVNCSVLICKLGSNEMACYCFLCAIFISICEAIIIFHGKEFFLTNRPNNSDLESTFKSEGKAMPEIWSQGIFNIMDATEMFQAFWFSKYQWMISTRGSRFVSSQPLSS